MLLAKLLCFSADSCASVGDMVPFCYSAFSLSSDERNEGVCYRANSLFAVSVSSISVVLHNLQLGLHLNLVSPTLFVCVCPTGAAIVIPPRK